MQVEIEAHQFFEREGYDIHVTVPITYSQAVLGVRVMVPTLGVYIYTYVSVGMGVVVRVRVRARVHVRVRVRAGLGVGVGAVFMYV